jgi:hypothetical protein
MVRWRTQFGHRGRQTLTIGSGLQWRMMIGTGRRGGNGGAADARVGVVNEHRAAEAEVGDTEVALDCGQWRLTTERRSGGAGAATRVCDRAEA